MIIIPFTGDETETENLTFKINTSKAEVQTHLDFLECVQLPSELGKMMWDQGESANISIQT